ALEACLRVLGEEHPSSLTAMNNLAVTLKALGDSVTARKLQEQVLGTRLRVLGKEHSNSLWAMSNLALTLYSQGDRTRARKLEEQVLETRRRLLGEEHPDTLTAKNSLARMKPKTLRHWLQLMLGRSRRGAQV
ncbi:MAG TPA: tetratricopeptide repeat protein, partial [Acidobacteriaceae bacterium]